MLRLKSVLNYRFGYLNLLIVAIIAFVSGNYYYNRSHVTPIDPEVTTLRSDNLKLSQDLVKANFQLTIERETIKEMNDRALNLQSNLIEQQLALRFYQKIMAPEFTTNGVNIEKVIIEAGVSQRHYRFEVLLAQLEKRKRYIKGSVKLLLIGSQDEKPLNIDLMSLTQRKKALTISFRYFQHLKDDFVLPVDFIPEKLKITITMPRKRGQKGGSVTQEYAWNELLKVPLKPILNAPEQHAP